MVVKETLALGAEWLRGAGILDAEIDAWLLFERVTGMDRAAVLLHPEQEVPKEDLAAYHSLLEQRAAHVPCQYLLHEAWFYGLPFYVDERVLIPRADTEVLAEEALKDLPEGARVLDLCTGSGAVAIAMKHERPDLAVTAADLSTDALDVARRNADALGCAVRFVQSDLFAQIEAAERFDVIVSNPPYIADAEYETLMPEVKEHEPELALLAGPEGLDLYRRLAKEAPAHLNAGGQLLVEIGCTQADAVAALFKINGFQDVRVVKDLAGLDRVVKGFMAP